MQSDINEVERFDSVKKSRVFNLILEKFNLKNKKVLDLGCSKGEYLVNFGAGSLGITTNDQEVLYGRSKSLNIIKGNAEYLDRINIERGFFEVIWANNLIEHLLSPHLFLTKLRNLADSNALLILGVPIIPLSSSLLRFRKFRGSLADSHVNFFTKKTLELTVERAGWKIKETRNFWFKYKNIDSFFLFLSPHVFIIAEKDNDFKYSDKKRNEWKDDLEYAKLLK